MAKPITMPQLGESVTEGTITRWLKAEGDEVEQDEPIAEVDTDKVNTELPSPLAGKLQKLLVPEGTTVDVGAEIALVATGVEGNAGLHPREDAAADAPTEEFPAAHTEAQPVAPASPAAEARPVSGGNGRAAASAEELRLRRSSPVVRRLAAEHGVEISSIPGTGIGGRVTKKDIEGFVEEQRKAPEPAKVAEPGAAPRRVTIHEGDRVEDLTGIRRAIAGRMALSKQEIPHAWTLVEVDVTGLVALREGEKAAFREREGAKLTYLPFIVLAAVEALKQNPVLNSVWDGDRIVLRKRINVGIAVDLDGALVVPVIPDADELNLTGLARRIKDAVRRARAGQLGPDDVSGGTFTVNNPGSLGSVASAPIINHPQAAILQAEAIVKRPVVIDDAIAIRSMMNLEVSFDHRVLDGGAALRFLNAVKRRLENYGQGSSLG
ncbi:MAG TPA: dihydrolipoamide acetyltransferase family protein [Rubrobacter sp.]|nr:dihydrolipoamide acetyltransferase family protein [Rubrobacter sp.]